MRVYSFVSYFVVCVFFFFRVCVFWVWLLTNCRVVETSTSPPPPPNPRVRMRFVCVCVCISSDAAWFGCTTSGSGSRRIGKTAEYQVYAREEACESEEGVVVRGRGTRGDYGTAGRGRSDDDDHHHHHGGGNGGGGSNGNGSNYDNVNGDDCDARDGGGRDSYVGNSGFGPSLDPESHEGACGDYRKSRESRECQLGILLLARSLRLEGVYDDPLRERDGGKCVRERMCV